jgi:SAM-dependent methyltransferase
MLQDGGAVVSRMYKLAYQLGVTPWEDAGAQSGFREHLSTILDRESAVQIEMPRALDIGCGTGDHSVEMAVRGWQVTGLDMVKKAVDRAREKTQAAGVNATFVVGDVTDLPESIGSGYQLVLDVGCFHGLSDAARAAYAREITAVTDPGASLLMFAFSPGRRGPLPRGASSAEIERTFSRWQLKAQESANTGGLAAPIRRTNPRWFHLSRMV